MTITILGLGPSRVQCPYNGEVWGVNTVYRYAQRLDKLYFFDDLRIKPHCEQMPLEEVAKVNKLVPIVTNRTYPELSNTEQYPIEEIVKYFHCDDNESARYFPNSIAFMIAHAIYIGAKRIEMYGIDHGGVTEYVMAKAAVEHWIGRALGMGIEVLVPSMASLLKIKNNLLYGYNGAVESAQEIYVGH